MSGRIEGGWEYVVAAYAISVVILAGYAVSVFVRHRREQARKAARSLTR
jgi:heme exporter protein D